MGIINPSSLLSTTPTIPKFYWDVKSQEQRIKVMCCLIQQLIDQYGSTDSQIQKNTEAIEELKELFTQFQESGFDDYYEQQVIKWIGDNIEILYQQLAKQVFFGLTSDGYFCAYVPESWSDITFDTGAVYDTKTYGRLILRFDADGSGVIDNTQCDDSMLIDTIDARIKTAAGDALRYENNQLNVDTGNGLAINKDTNMVEVPLGNNLRYTSNGIDVPDADDITRGVVKLTHSVNNIDGDDKVITSDGVYAYGKSFYGLNINTNIKQTTGLYAINYIYVGNGILLWYQGDIIAKTGDDKTPVVFFEDKVKLANKSYVWNIHGKMVFRGIPNTNGLAFSSEWDIAEYTYIQTFIPIIRP